MNKENLKQDLALAEYDSDEQMTLEVGVNYQGSFRINPNGTIKVRRMTLNIMTKVEDIIGVGRKTRPSRRQKLNINIKR